MRNVDPVLSNKLSSQYQTKANNAQPKMSVAIARARNTVSDSSYWVVETIRTGSTLGDVSLAPRRQKVTGSPDRIYEIHVYNGEVRTSIREYPDKFKDGFQHQFSLGAGSNVAIAFDGEWERYRNLWRLVTHEKPWIFWVDSSKTLWAQLWDDTSTLWEVATNVEYCRAIRAWKNLNMADHDQGVVVGYIKTDGKVYYRNYCQKQDLSYVWETERQVTEFTGTAESLNLFITNDYRMGFVVEDSLNDIYWYITDRNWAGMAIAADTLTVAPAELSVDLIPIQYYDGYMPDETISVAPAELGVDLRCALTHNDFHDIYNEPITVLNEELEEVEDWGKVLTFTTDHRLYDISASSFELIGQYTSYYPDTITEIEYKKYRLTFDGTNNFNNAGNTPILRYNQGQTVNGVGVAYDVFEKQFDAVNLVPTSIPLPEVEVIYNE
jgi:hypothetical protein